MHQLPYPWSCETVLAPVDEAEEEEEVDVHLGEIHNEDTHQEPAAHRHHVIVDHLLCLHAVQRLMISYCLLLRN